MRIKIIISCLVLITTEIFSQLKITLESEKQVYTSDDSILVTYIIENDSYSTLTFIDIGSFSEPDHCWSVYDYHGNFITGIEKTRELSDFQSLYPGEKIKFKRSITIAWLCRSVPKWEKEMNFIINYNLEITEKDNYYIMADVGGEHKVPFDAWTGSAKSNNINITIKMEDYK